MITKSRKDYFKKRRENLKGFSCNLNKEFLEEFEEYLKQNNLTKTKWLTEKIQEEMANKKKEE